MARTFFILQNVSPSVGVLLLREEVLSTMGCFRRYICFVDSKLYLTPALRDAFDVTFVSSAQSYPVSFVSGPFRKSVSSVLVDCMSLFMVGLDRWLSAFFYSLA